MIVTCDQCGSRYKLDENKISGRGARITCPSCRHVFVVYKDGAKASGGGGEERSAPRARTSTDGTGRPISRVVMPPTSPSSSASGGGGMSLVATAHSPSASVVAAVAPSPPPPPPPPPKPKLRANELDFRKVGIQAWKVKVKIGLVYDFNDLNTLRKYIQDGRVTEADLLSHNGQTWTAIGELGDLDAHFIEVYLEAERIQAAAKASPVAPPALSRSPSLPPRNEFDDDSPTMIVGMGDLAESITSSMEGSTGPGLLDTPAAAPPPRPRKSVPPPARVASGSKDQAHGPSFVDPFQQMREKRRGPSNGRAPQARSRVPRAAPTPNPVEKKSGGIGAAGVVFGGLVVVAVLAGLAFVFLTPPETGSGKNPAAPVGTQASGKSSSKGGPEDPAAARNQMLERLEADMEPLKADAPSWEADEKPALTVVVPKDVRDGRSRPSGTNNLGTQPNNSGGVSVSETTARDHAAIGDQAMASGDYGGAVRAYGEATQKDPFNASFREKLGIAQYKAGDSRSARTTLSNASKSGAATAEKWLGHIARDQGDVGGALGHYTAYLRTNPSDSAEIQRQMASLQGG